jgi:hypothetical protein
VEAQRHLGCFSSCLCSCIASRVLSCGLPRRPINGQFVHYQAHLEGLLDYASDHKSFTFVRLTLMPALRNNTKKDERCDLHEFLLSVLTEFVSNYLDIVRVSNAIPFSRSKWQDNETERLLIAREEQERNRSFFQSYGGVYQESIFPTKLTS